jgi:hypothetical protein
VALSQKSVQTDAGFSLEKSLSIPLSIEFSYPSFRPAHRPPFWQLCQRINRDVVAVWPLRLSIEVLTEQLSYSLFLELPKRLGFEN